MIVTKRVSVLFRISSRRSQKRSTFESSKGASTSSRTQMGEGFVRNTAKIRDIAVKACSPPDNNVIVWGFLPGGRARISRPASNGSSLSTNCNSAEPPPKSRVKSSLKCILTLSKATSNRSRPSLFKLAIAARSFLIASDRSSRSAIILSRCVSISLSSSSARKFTAPRRSRSDRNPSRRPSTVAISGKISPSLRPASSARSSTVVSRSCVIACAMSKARCRAASNCASLRAFSSRAKLIASSAIRAARSASISRFSAAVRASVASRRAISASSSAFSRARCCCMNVSGA